MNRDSDDRKEKKDHTENRTDKATAYDEMANTAAFYLNYMQQKSAEAFAAMKEALTDE